ncbi:hypothetical protein [Sphingobium ummariense]|uniref:Uncharacterized protein n=1 Tax=Sphingobium ummariense RL-3 TaxID=1346791 RepID=T0J607_9SPHN|nr:hypothetical protein [Sphingobium ummariense]EQB32247.1 hypothetical protein M529_10620 [Sphingobium ummariense RL-3]
MGMMQHPNTLPPMPAVQRILLRYARHDRESLEAFLSLAIDFLDLLDGDPDLENGNDAEDDFVLSAYALASASDTPGCAVSEPDSATYIEWHTRGSHKLSRGGGELLARDAYGNALHEDDENDDPAEDDDPGGGNVEDEPQMGAGEDYYPEKPRYGVDQSAGAINADVIRMRHHLNEQLAELEASGSHEYARQIRSRLTALDKREAVLAANEN